MQIENGADLDAGLEALFAKGEAAELREIVAKGCTAGDGVSTMHTVIKRWAEQSEGA